MKLEQVVENSTFLAHYYYNLSPLKANLFIYLLQGYQGP